jgi:hypothetical protein
MKSKKSLRNMIVYVELLYEVEILISSRDLTIHRLENENVMYHHH